MNRAPIPLKIGCTVSVGDVHGLVVTYKFVDTRYVYYVRLDCCTEWQRMERGQFNLRHEPSRR
jgi:hypothetical protein